MSFTVLQVIKVVNIHCIDPISSGIVVHSSLLEAAGTVCTVQQDNQWYSWACISFFCWLK
jgi:hypothetical protein